MKNTELDGTAVSRRGFVASVAAAAVTAGCVSESEADEQPDAEVEMRTYPNQKYSPEFVRVPVGGTVRWVLESGSHDVTAYHPGNCGRPHRIPEDAEPWASPVLSDVGQTFEHTFEVEGIYDYLDTQTVCVEHETVGVVGRVVVGEPDLDGAPAMEPPQDGMPRTAATKIRQLNERTREELG